MTTRVQLPSEAHVRQALTELAAQPGTGRPTVLALARNLGLANGTFWRHFPDIAREVAEQRRTASRQTSTVKGQAQSGQTSSADELTRLRRQAHELEDQLEVAIAHLRRLTLENHALREELENCQKITRLPGADRARGL